MMENKNTEFFMNEPEPSTEYYEKKEMLLRELKEYKKLGMHREWFREVASQWLEMKTREPRNYWKETAYEECLRENLVPDFSDVEYADITLKTQNKLLLPAGCVWIVRDVIKRKLVLERTCAQAKELLAWEAKETSKTVEETKDTYMAGMVMLAECITLVGKENDISEIHVWEKNLLQQQNVEMVMKCLRSGFFVKEHAEEYLDFLIEKGAKELIPLFVSLKFKGEN